MKKLTKGLAACLLCTMAANTALADCNSNSCQSVLITSLYTRADGGAYITVGGNMAALNCTLYGGTYLTLPTASARFKEIYATLLAHQLSNQPVTVRIDETSNGCTVAYITSP